MNKTDIIALLKQCGCIKDTAVTLIGQYSDSGKASSLTSQSVTNRSNSAWGRAEYVVIEHDPVTFNLPKALDGWKALAKKYRNQYLILEVSAGNWKVYDHDGKDLGGPEYIEKMFEDRDTDEYSLQKIFFGCPGTGKSYRVNQIIKESADQRRLRFAKYLKVRSFTDSTIEKYLGVPNIGWIIDIAKDQDNVRNEIKTVYEVVDSDVIKEISAAVAKTEGDKKGKQMYSKALEYYSAMLNHNTVFRTTFHPDTDYASFVGCYKPQMGDTGNIEYSFCPQIFTEAYITAWKNPYTTIYLVIEEINRGNCAQIFGDLFQLLDRKNGYSEYPIKADKDLADYIEKKLGKGHEGIAQRELRLPPNLTILATMNTSDQSLFPMDSAFKRRWDWEYVQIEPSHPESQFKINISGKTYNWADFLTEVNKRITVLTDSEDKMLGNFFIKDNINEEEFKSKVMFYLWSEVCKDYVHADTFFRSSKVIDGKEVQEEFTFSQLYESNASETLEGFMKFLGILEFVEKPEDYLEDDTTDEETNETGDTNI